MSRSLVLYVHPWGHLNDLVVPAGAVACMNAIAGPKLGRYAFEVSDAELREAAVLCVDVHWALALSGFERLVAHARAVAPDVVIVVGGITAAHLAPELLDAYPIDYVLRGDAEVSFAALVEAVRAGRRPSALANVHARGEPPPPRARMSEAAFDATDSVTLDWFPTLAKVTDLDAVAFPPGRTVIVARGCPLRCPSCYGSHASTYGPGYLWRSPARTAALVRSAERAGARNLRLIVGKPSPRRLSALFDALGAEGPYRLGSAVGLYLCRAPSDDELDALDRAFDSPVTLSVVPPEEHVPALSRARLAEERAAWVRVAARVARSRNLRLDVWATAGRDTTSLRAELEPQGLRKNPLPGVLAPALPVFDSPKIAELLRPEGLRQVDPSDPLCSAPQGSARVSVSSGAVWSMTRPSDGQAVPLAAARAAVASIWTFYAARLLSPALARMLAPFRFLDEVDDGLEAIAPPPEPALRAFHSRMFASWREHRLPTLPGLAFEAVPVALADGPPRATAEGTRFRGDLGVVEAEDVRPLADGAPLVERLDHRGVSLEASLDAPGADALAIVPRCPGLDARGSLAAMASRGLVVLRSAADGRGARRLRIDLRVQDARAFLLDGDDAPLRRGVADLAYFREARAERAARVPSRDR